MLKGAVHGSRGGVYRVFLDSGELVEASLRGRLKLKGSGAGPVVVGDRVVVGLDPQGSATVEEVLPRRSQVVRRGAGGRRPKVVAANVDRLVVVAAVSRPEPRQGLLDRLLVVGEANHLETILVLNKMDLQEGLSRAEALAALYRGVGYLVSETSCVTGAGLSGLEEFLGTGVSALVGPSGAGKSSLLNALVPGLSLRTGELSHRKGRGRQTTVSSRLIPVGRGGLVADTPGFSDAGVWGVEKGELSACFPEFRSLGEGCQFRSCAHLQEPGCRVREALEGGLVDPGRFESYRILLAESG